MRAATALADLHRAGDEFIKADARYLAALTNAAAFYPAILLGLARVCNEE